MSCHQLGRHPSFCLFFLEGKLLWQEYPNSTLPYVSLDDSIF